MLPKTLDERYLSILEQEYPIAADLPEEWSVYVLLNFSERNTIKGRTTIQKILCNLMFEKNILLPYLFQKDNFGPFDPNIQKNIEKLENEGEVKEVKKEEYTEHYEAPSYRVFLTTNGLNTYQREIKPKLEKDRYVLESFKSMTQLTGYPTTKLAGFCYDELYLFNEVKPTETESAWMHRRFGWVREIVSSLSKNKSRWMEYVDIPEDFRFYFLTSIDYFEKILAKENLLKIDQVKSGIVLYNISRFNRLTSKLLDFAKANKTGYDVDKLFTEISRLFYFVNEYSGRIGLFPSLFNEDADLLSFMAEGDRKRVMAALNGS